MSKTRHALVLYYLAVGFLTICAVVIVVKLIVFPPCAPRGNTCVVDPWSAAGLESAVLGVSATVLAILGAVAVAAWWTALNERVKDQVSVLYEVQRREVNAQVDGLLTDQQKKVDAQIAEFGSQLNSVQQDVKRTKVLAEEMNALSKRSNDIFSQITERSEQETEILRETHNTQKELLTSMQNLVVTTQQRAATINSTFQTLKTYVERQLKEFTNDPEKQKSLLDTLEKGLQNLDNTKDPHEG